MDNHSDIISGKGLNEGKFSDRTNQEILNQTIKLAQIKAFRAKMYEHLKSIYISGKPLIRLEGAELKKILQNCYWYSTSGLSLNWLFEGKITRLIFNFLFYFLFFVLELSRDYLGYLNNNIEAIFDNNIVLALKVRMTVMKEIRNFGLEVNQRKWTVLYYPTSGETREFYIPIQ
jgi:hypothetical protein